MQQPSHNRDVRMRGFAQRATVDQAISWLDGQTGPLAVERVPLSAASGRVLADQIVSSVDVPQFARSMMDGFALVASDTQGASSYNRLPLRIVGQSMPGSPYEDAIVRGAAVRIMTGAPMPQGANAVLPVEYVEVEDDRLLALATVSPGQHVGQVGEDIAVGSVVLASGRRLRPQDVGVLASIGCGEVPVARRPRVRIVVTGNELLPVGSKPEGHRIVDSNGPMLDALVQRDGGLVLNPGIVPDTPEAILDAMQTDADMVLVSGGSSVGQEDFVPSLLREHGELPIHGISMRPSSPAGMGLLAGKLVFLLPGNPVSCLCAYDHFAGRAIRALGGRSTAWPYRRIERPLARKIVSTVGRHDYVRVRLTDDGVEPLAIGGSAILSSTTRADGFVLVPPDKEGWPPGAVVEVFLYDA